MVAGGITIFALAMGAYPFYEVQKHKAEANSLSEKEGALSGSQIQRGQYINTGSQDIGRDPDWDFKEHKWRGKRVKIEKWRKKPAFNHMKLHLLYRNTRTCVHIDLDQLHSTKLCSISFYNQFLFCDCECKFVFSVQMATMMFMGVMVESNITEGKQKCTPGVASENQSDLRQQWSSKK